MAAERRRFLDVWLVQPNTVYRDVPHHVVCDWLTQGRILAEDKLRWAGTTDWFRVNETSAFSDFLPRPEPHRAEDKAEALEPVELEVQFHRRRRFSDDDDDVDMIPLIDVSLVLLIFFMMTAAVAGTSGAVPMPEADNGSLTERAKMIWIGINLEGEREPRQLIFSIGLDDKPPGRPEDNRISSQDELLARFDELLTEQGRVDVSINAHPEVRSGVVRQLTIELNQPGRREKIIRKFTGVRDRP